MKRLIILFIFFFFAGVLLSYKSTPAHYWDFPPPPPSNQYGNILINRTSEKNNMKPATFSHWSHRMHYTCRVCHLELGFEMKLNTTEITEEANKAGKFCGACHDGKIAFGHGKENCDKCHNGDIGYGKEKFIKLENFPKTGFGNKVDWAKAIKDGLLKPTNFIFFESTQMSFNKTLDLEAEWSGIPPAIFPHEAHIQWLDCSNCHPDIFNIKKKTTKHFSMELSLEGKFCGVCHLKVAFPLNDCKRCHPTMSE
ncbi:MAG: cytochrome c3 family protein [Nitrospirota bacterium]|nr:cytochrome c3 family protein [Nitrospirota bacterium]